jgi:hypothetical protein
MARNKPRRIPLLEQVAAGLSSGEIPLALAIELAAPGVIERAWVEQPFTVIPFSESPSGVRVSATRLRGASVFTKTTDFDGPNVYVDVLIHTRPDALFATLRLLRESMDIPRSAPSDDLTAAEALQRAGEMKNASHWATQVTRILVSRVCGFHGHPAPPGPCTDAPIVMALRAIGPPTLEEIVAAATWQAGAR